MPPVTPPGNTGAPGSNGISQLPPANQANLTDFVATDQVNPLAPNPTGYSTRKITLQQALSLVGAGSPGGADTNIQFNNAGVFGGDANLTWVSSTGLTDLNYMAVGSLAKIGTGAVYAGDPVHQVLKPFNSPLGISNFTLGDLSAPVISSGSYVLNGFKHTGAGGAQLYGLYFLPSVNSDSAGPVANFTGVSSLPINFGSGTVTQFFAGNFGITHNSSTALVKGANVYSQAVIEGPVTDFYSILAAQTFAFAGAITNHYGVKIEAPLVFGTLANNYGLMVDDQSGVGSTTALNIWSKGTTSRNVFDGGVETTPVAFASLPAAAHAGRRMFINNSPASPVFAAAAAGGGTLTIPVYDDGTIWRNG
jgi:hypothetical protein